ncbi:kinesin light chain : : TPR_1 [Gemmata massiliana]|uniref:Kinesin light chain:: TPR_1 n=2 Tax=Gemmata massiliana TaxID=1210884 RepID=A0A6P2CZ74_9BACT|nr:kinesin light chain : : TPR_1 [Gemmata massiliana]
MKEAERHYLKGLAIFQELTTKCADVPEYRVLLANTHSNLGVLLSDLDRLQEAGEHYRKGLVIRE